LVVNMVNLAIIDARYCAVDPGDTIRITVARETGSASIAFVMDGAAKVGSDEYIVAGGLAFQQNAALKEALSKGTYAPVSFWNLQMGRFVKVPRERAGFALLKAANPPPRASYASVPGAVTILSLVASVAVCAVGVSKVVGKRGVPRG